MALTAADKLCIDDAVNRWSRTIGLPNGLPFNFTDSIFMTAGAGLVLDTSGNLNVVANADGSIVVNANDVQVGVISATQHGTLAGGTTHAAATDAAAGFLSAAAQNVGGLKTFKNGIANEGVLNITLGDSSAAPGAATLNTIAGRSAVAIGADNVVVTDNKVAAGAIVQAWVQQAAADATFTQVLRTSVNVLGGEFTIYGDAVATAATVVSWLVINPV